MQTCCNKVFRSLYSFGEKCGKPATRVRDENGIQRPFCAECDPVRKAQVAMNQKQRKANKKQRWKQLETQK